MNGRQGAIELPGVEALARLGLARPEAEALAPKLQAELDSADPLGSWRRIARGVLVPAHPFAVHRLVHDVCFAGWDGTRGPAPGWVPGEEEMAATNLGGVMGGDYRAYHRRSVEQPEAHWSEMLQRLRIAADRPAERILDLSAGAEHARWLAGMRLNIARAALERDPAALAVVYQREGGAVERHSLGELRLECARVARALGAAGFGPGDAIAVCLPMSYEAVQIYLGIVIAGAVVVSIADSFAAPEIATRLRIGQAKAIFTQDVVLRAGKALPLYERVVRAGAPRAIVLAAEGPLAASLRAGDISWCDFLATAPASDAAPPYAVAEAEAPTNVLFSSGTTGEPKAIPWSHTTPIKAAADGWAHHDLRRGDIVAWPTSLGWMMGPWLIYASLLNDAAIALFDGSSLARPFGRFVQDARVTMLGLVPSLVKAWKASDCMDGLDWSGLRLFSSTGESSSPDEMLWLMGRAGYRPVIEYCGGTEIGGGYIAGTLVQPQVPAAFSTPALGCDFVILDEQGRPAEQGELCLAAPMLGSSNRLLGGDHHEIYFAGMPRGPRGELLRRHGDQMKHLGGGYVRAMGRVDDTMKLGGIKVASAEIERVCNACPAVVETAAVAAEPPEGGPSRLVVYAVPAPGAEGASATQLRAELQQAISREMNPLFRVHEVVLVESLPRTASNKVMRRMLRARGDGR
ncbi:MAG: AMP-binding protein [Deltaproteobacteria bacterium]|nr:AMP-binding protein [Deltaproteobacteria bacterium]